MSSETITEDTVVSLDQWPPVSSTLTFPEGRLSTPSRAHLNPRRHRGGDIVENLKSLILELYGVSWRRECPQRPLSLPLARSFFFLLEGGHFSSAENCFRFAFPGHRDHLACMKQCWPHLETGRVATRARGHKLLFRPGRQTLGAV